MSDVFRTPVDAARPHSSGWVRVGDVDVLAIPLIDARIFDEQTWLTFARLSHNDLEQVAAREDARLVSMATLRACWETGLRLKPVQLVRTQQDTRLMRGKGFCDEHDRRVWEQLGAAGWEGGKVVANIGKNWLRETTSANARNGGWFNAAGEPVQPGGPGSEHHDRDYTDYSQIGTLEKPANITPPSTPLGERALAFAAAEERAGVREVPGPGNNPRVSGYHACTVRNGKPTGLRDDSLAWCASAASWCLLQALQPGEPRPHEPRCSVREIVEDAKERGHWRERDWRPFPGDLAIFARAGGDPTKGGLGHVARVVSVHDEAFVTLGANEQDGWRYSDHQMGEASLRGFVRYPR